MKRDWPKFSLKILDEEIDKLRHRCREAAYLLATQRTPRATVMAVRLLRDAYGLSLTAAYDDVKRIQATAANED